MPTPESILQKIKHLQKLGSSSNPNEAEAAQTMAAKLIAKYNVTQEELNTITDKAPAYGEDELLFETIGIVSWRSQLALALGVRYDCQIVQETFVPVAEGDNHNKYYIYGEPEDVEDVKFLWNALAKKVEELVLTKCVGRGNIFIHSYTEGVVDSIKKNLEFQDIELPKSDSLKKSSTEDNLVKQDTMVVNQEKEKPTSETYNVASDSIIKDIMAYFKGLDDGKNIRLQDIAELSQQSEEINSLPQEN